jgi:hypothetical protein
VRIGVATCAAVPPHFDDDALLVNALHALGADATRVEWTDPGVRWDQFDRVVIRSTWDYSRKHEAFLSWVDALEPRVQNPARLVRWNSDKHHLADLADAGVPVVPTHFVEPGDRIPRLTDEVVVKPAISAGGRDTGRFDSTSHGQAKELITRLHREGRSALIQPYMASVDSLGEVALVFIGGQFSHAAHKRAVLRSNEVAPLRDDEIGGAEVMYDPTLVVPGAATDQQIEVATSAIAYLCERFDASPLYARVDLVSNGDGASLLLELEAVEPNLFLRYSEGAAYQLAAELTVN